MIQGNFFIHFTVFITFEREVIKMSRKKLTALLTSFVMFVMVFVPALPSAKAAGTMREISTQELVRDMGIGINLGNTLEACGDWIN